jgi:hypothetical protein
LVFLFGKFIQFGHVICECTEFLQDGCHIISRGTKRRTG